MEDALVSMDKFRGRESSSGIIRLDPDHLDDTALWNAFRKGDDRALVYIFDAFSKSLFSYGIKIINEEEVVKDNIQDLFLELCKNRERLGATDSIKFYLLTSLRRKLVRWKMKMPLLRNLLEGSGGHSPSPEFILEAEQESQELKKKMDSALHDLAPRQREALYLRYYEDLTYDEISAVMRIRKQAIYNLINVSLKRLKKVLDQAPSHPTLK